MSTSGTKMSDYTPLANNEKEYFMGDGQGAVVTVGKVEQGGDNVNRLVKLSDLAPAELPSAGTNEHRGDVLTVDNTDQVVWAAPQGGGGGGNPYTKTTVTPGTRYDSGKTMYGFKLFDQDVSISNNTYSVVSTAIGYDSTAEMGESHGIDVFKIKLPANTEFPMAVVEFSIYPYAGQYECGAVNDVEVYVGETKLTKILPHPYRKDTLVGTDLDSDEGQEHETAYGQDYWHINGIHNGNTLFSKTAFVATESTNPIVQVNIFGNCFTLSTNAEANEPAAS